VFAGLAAACALIALGAAGQYHADFSSAEVGKVPADMQVLSGAFKVAEVGRNKALELPGEPLDAFGVLFGPAGPAEVDVRARVWSESSGRRFPEFGVGAGDVGGYRLLLLPSQNRLELRKGDEAITSVEAPQRWQSGVWTWVRLKISRRAQGRWTVEGKSWPDSTGEPAQWPLMHEVTEAPPSGRASVWGVPFSGRPIRFDDLSVEPATP
jgi:hypothetical protein